MVWQIEYSDKYNDERYEYRHVIIPKDVAKSIGIFDKGRLFTEFEWRSLGIQQSRGWEHYAIHRPEPHILLFRRPLGTVGLTLSDFTHSDSLKVGSYHRRSEC